MSNFEQKNIKTRNIMKLLIILYSCILTISTLSSCENIKSLLGEKSEHVVGGYSKQRKPTHEEVELFNLATASLQGVEYKPINVATQIVAGTNYRFLCKARSTGNDKRGKRYYAVIVIHKPLTTEEQPRILSIERESR